MAEPNDSLNSATWLGLVQGGPWTWSDDSMFYRDQDYFAFQISDTGRPDNYIRIDSDSIYYYNMDLFLVLFDESGNELASSQRAQESYSDHNSEYISLAGLSAGVYGIGVFDRYRGDYLYPNAAAYALTIQAPQISLDGYESNNSFAAATLLGTLNGGQYLSNLSINDPTDVDWFSFTTTDWSTTEHYIATYFDPVAGRIDLELYDSSGNLLYYSYGDYGWNGIPLAGLPEGTYYIQAGSYSGDTSPSYDLAINAPVALSDDPLESNDSFSSSAGLGTVEGFGSQGELSVHRSGDIDWFQFEITAQAGSDHYLSIDFDNSQGDLDLALYDANGQLLNYTLGSSDLEGLSLSGLTPGTYYASVYSYQGATNDYTLNINAPGNTSEIVRDQFENNNTQRAAKSLRNPDFGWREGVGAHAWENLSLDQGDEDWFKLELTAEGKAGNFIAITLDNSLGDLDLELYDSSGTRLKQAAGVRDIEQISLENLAQGTYYARVVGYQGAQNPQYTLLVNTPGNDAFEENDRRSQAKELFHSTYQQSWADLSINATNDDDWFKLELPRAATANDYVRINFDHSLGDLDLTLYDSQGKQVLDSSTGVSNTEQVSLAGLAAGTYLVKVYGYNGATNPDYTLTLNAAPPSTSGDWAEPNNTQQKAENLNQQRGAAEGLRTWFDPEKPLSIHKANDVDWFKFTIAASGQQGNYAGIAFDHTLGDLDLELYDASGELLRTSTGVAANQIIDLKDLEAGDYYLKVFGYNGATNPSYGLMIDAPWSQAVGDWAEGDAGNNKRQQAKDLGTINSFSQGNLSIHGRQDADWFKFAIAAQGSQDDSIGITFNHGQGDLDIELYAADGTSLDSSQSVSGFEEISLEGYAADTYYLKVYGFNGATNPDYNLLINAPEDRTGDWAEKNDTQRQAEDLRNVEGLQTWDSLSIHKPGNEDWFKFTTVGNADAKDLVGILFDQTLGDLDLYLYDATGTTLLGSAETAENFEQVQLTDAQGSYLPQGTYLIKVVGHNDATNPNYQLLINAPNSDAADWAEVNNTKRTAEDLQEVQGSQVWSGLSIHQGGDEDWFSFTTVGEGQSGDSVGINFDHNQGNLSLLVITPGGEQLTSVNISNREQVSLAGLPQGKYFAKVFGATGTTTNPDYSLTINAPETPEADWAEANDSQSAAHDLRNLDGTLALSDLSVHPSDDQDWFQFNLTTAPVTGQSVQIDFDHSAGDLTLKLIDPAGKRYTSATSRNFEEIFLAGKGQGTYYIQVSGAKGATNPNYTLTVNGPQALEPDQAEVNDTPEDAYNLRDVSRTTSTRSSGSLFEALGPELANFLLPNGAWNTSFLTSPPFTQDGFSGLAPEIAAQVSALGFNPDAIIPPSSAFLNPNSTISALNPIFTNSSALHSLAQQDPDGAAFLAQNQLAFQPALANVDNIIANFGGGFGGGIIGGVPVPTLLGPINSGPALNPQFDSFFAGTLGNISNQLGLVGLDFGSLFERSNAQALAVLPDLSIHSETDVDWFQFTLGDDGEDGQFVGITFDDDQGDLKLDLFEAFASDTDPKNYNKYLVDTSNGRRDAEEIDLAGLVKGTYYARVSGVDDATNPNYDLTLSATPEADATGDWAEPNNRGAAPYDIRTVRGTRVLSGLSIHKADDLDWFQFETKAAGKQDHRVRIDFSHAQGDLDLVLYDAKGVKLGQSESTKNFEQVNLKGLAAGTYQLKVSGYSGATNPQYTLTLNAPEPATAVTPDPLEPNNSFASATDLSQVTDINHVPGLTIHAGDSDYFKFTTTATGTSADSISIGFQHSLGDLQLQLYQAGDRTPIYESAGTSDNETISLNGLAAGTYYARAFADGTNVTNNYELHFDAPTVATPTQDDWTLMVYMTASDLAQFGFKDINEMESAVAQLPGTVNLAVLWDQSSALPTYATGESPAWGDTGRAIIRPDVNNQSIATYFEQIGEQNTGAAKTLKNFVNWAAEAAPAENYGLIMWDHGGGDLGGFNLDNEGDTSDASADRMYTDELVTALSDLDSGIELDLLAFDACLMAMTEVGYTLSDYTDVFVASEETEAGDGYDYTTALSALQRNPGQVTAEALASSIVASYEAQYVGNTPNGDDTHSASDTDQFSPLASALNTFTTAVENSATATDWNLLQVAREAATSFLDSPDFRDLGQFMAGIVNSEASRSIRSGAEGVFNTLQDLIVAKTSDQRNTQGLSIYLPGSGGTIDSGYLDRNQQFLDATGWSGFLSDFVSQQFSRSSSVALDWSESNEVAARAYNLHTLVGNDHTFTDLSLDRPADQDWFRFTTLGTATTTDKVNIAYDNTNSQELSLSLYRTNSSGERVVVDNSNTGSGQETVNLSGLAAGEYLLLVQGNGSAVIPEYSITINAPDASVNDSDWASGNNRSAKAHDLGVISAESLFSGLTVAPNTEDWFLFETPKNQIVNPGTVSITVADGKTATAELFRADGTSLDSQTGTGEIQIGYPEGPGQTYQIQISQATNGTTIGYSLGFHPNDTITTRNSIASNSDAQLAAANLERNIATTSVTDLNWSVGRTGDFNRDEQTDILWRHSGAGSNQGLNPNWLMDSTTFGSSTLLASSDLGQQISILGG